MDRVAFGVPWPHVRHAILTFPWRTMAWNGPSPHPSTSAFGRRTNVLTAQAG